MISRDFRAETLYFLLVDRFCNGDPENDLGDNPACSDPTHKNWLRYFGGDLQGVLDRLDYLRAIGATTIWLSPIFDQIDALANDEGRLSAPYHGYWTKDFKRIDEHFLPKSEWHRPFADRGTLFDRLIAAAHAKDLRVILGVACNHTSGGGPGAPKGEIYDDGVYLTSFDDDRLGWYHRHGPIRDWNSPRELDLGELHGLADLNEDVWSFRHYITQTMSAWLDRGVDGFRLDAVKHMALSFWQEFTAIMRERHPEVTLFGEWAGVSPQDVRGVHFANASGMSVLDFGFRGAAEDVLCHGHHFRRLAKVFYDDHVYDDATELVTFLDSHDMPRLLSIGLRAEHLPLAIALLLTVRGVPCLYYGMEQGLHDDTNGGGDPHNRPLMQAWDTGTPAARALATLSALRRRSLAVQRGFVRDVLVEQDIYAYVRGYHHSSVLVVLNKGEAATIRLEGVLLPDGAYSDLLGLLDHPVPVQRDAISELRVPAGAALVFESSEPLPLAKTRIVARLNGYATQFGEHVAVVGNAPELGRFNPDHAARLYYVNQNLWMGDLLFDESAGREILYRYVIVDSLGRVRYEDRLPRRSHVPTSGVVSWKDRWET